MPSLVITCAVTGAFDTAGKSAAVPVTPSEIAASALDAAKAGAAVVHIHVRDPQTKKASMEQHLYAEVVERIREQNPDVLIDLTTGAGGRYIPDPDDPSRAGTGTNFVSPAARLRHVEALKPQICSLDVGSMNFGEVVFINTPTHLREMAERARASGTKPEIEVFDLGQIEFAKQLIKEGRIAEPPLFQLCLGIPYGAPATPETMIQMRDRLPANAVWSGFGISRMQFPMVALAAMLGGNVRVGLEDNLYLAHGELAPSNAALVDKAVNIIELLGYSAASPAEARRTFGLEGATG